jgi:4'-phosphopantetheinyl transferase
MLREDDKGMSLVVAPCPAGMQALPLVYWFDAALIELGPADLAVLSPAERARAASLAFPVDQHRYLVAHVLLRRLLGEVTDTSPARLQFGREPCPECGGLTGRPRLSGRETPHFSLSHSGDKIAIAIGPDPVGIDCERLAAGCVCELMTQMHPDDASLVAGLPEPRRHADIIGWWVRAEAVLKCRGQGIAHGMSGFRVLDARAASGEERGLADGCRVAQIEAPAGYAAALAVVARRA